MLTPLVLNFIRQNFLYLDEPIYRYIKKNLDNAKYRHTIGVANLSKDIAERVGANPQKAFISGLIHDIGRCVSSQRYLEICLKNNLIPEKYLELYRRAPFLLHSYISAYLARKIFGIQDQEVLNAARNHTVMTTKDKATIYDKIVYVSDAVSPDRRYPGVEKIRNVALIKGDIDKAVFMVSAVKIYYVIKKKKYLMPQGVDVYNSFLSS